MRQNKVEWAQVLVRYFVLDVFMWNFFFLNNSSKVAGFVIGLSKGMVLDWSVTIERAH